MENLRTHNLVIFREQTYFQIIDIDHQQSLQEFDATKSYQTVSGKDFDKRQEHALFVKSLFLCS